MEIPSATIYWQAFSVTRHPWKRLSLLTSQCKKVGRILKPHSMNSITVKYSSNTTTGHKLNFPHAPLNRNAGPPVEDRTKCVYGISPYLLHAWNLYFHPVYTIWHHIMITVFENKPKARNTRKTVTFLVVSILSRQESKFLILIIYVYKVGTVAS